MVPHPERILKHVGALVPDPSLKLATDAELLERYVRGNDEDAFADVVCRHGPMVIGVCRRVLHDSPDAEDVAQGVFLVLARQARSIRRPDALSGWLHKTARRLALNHRRAALRGLKRETRVFLAAPARTVADPLDELSVRELLAIFDEEVQRLPEQYRLPLILCCLEGCTQEEAVRRLGWTPGSVKGRLERARQRLHERLVRRGVSLSAALVSLEATRGGASAAGFVARTTRAGLLFASGIGGIESSVARDVVAMVEGGIHSRAIPKLMAALLLLLAVGVVGAGVLAATFQGSAEKSRVGKQTAVSDQPAEKEQTRIDLYGDALPKDALARLGTIRWRTQRTDALAYSPDGKTIAAAAGLEIIFFDMEGKVTTRIRPGDKFADRVAFSPDGKRVTCRCYGQKMIAPGRFRWPVHTVQVWELQPARMVQEYEAEGLQWLGWSVDGKPVGIVVVKGAVLFRELATGREQRLECKEVVNWGADSRCWCAYSPAANSLAAFDQRAVIHVWDVSTGRKRCTLETKHDWVSSAAFSPDGRRLASLAQFSNGKYAVQLWDLTTAKPSDVPAGDQRNPHAVAFAPDGTTLATAGWSEVRFYDTTTRRERSRTRGPTNQATIAFSPDGNTLATVDREGGTIQRWDIRTGALKPAPTGHAKPPYRIAFSPDGTQIATGSWEASFLVWRPTTGELLAQFRGDGGSSCAFSADGRTLFSATSTDSLTFSDATSGRVLKKLRLTDPDRPGTRQYGPVLHLSTDHKTLVALSRYEDAGAREGDGDFRLITGWDAVTHKQLFRRRRPQLGVGLAVSPDARMLAAPAGDVTQPGVKGWVPQQIRLEDLATGEHLLTIPPVGRQSWPVAFSADGRLLATVALGQGLNRRVNEAPGENDQILLVWELETAKEVLSLPIGPSGRMAFSADNRLLALFGSTGEIVVWDLRRGQERQRFSGLGSFGNSIAFSPDSQLLVSGLMDTTLLVWKVATERRVDKPVVLNAAGIARAWSDLAGEPHKAFAARGALAHSPKAALPLLKERLKPVQPADPAQMRRLLAEVDGDSFETREKARKELEQLGDRASGALQEALKRKPSLEAKRRIEVLLRRLRLPITDGNTLRGLRAVAVLEDIGTPESRTILIALAEGAPTARLTCEAKATLERLARRTVSSLAR